MTADDVVDLFAPHATVRCRAMFGGIGVYCEGVMVAIVADGELYMKADAETEAAFAAADSAPFVYEARGRTTRMSYWRLPEAAFDDPDALASWLALAQEAARRAAATRKPKRTKAPPRRPTA